MKMAVMTIVSSSFRRKSHSKSIYPDRATMRKRRMEWEMKIKKKWTNMDRRKEKRPRVGCERQHCFHIYIYI